MKCNATHHSGHGCRLNRLKWGENRLKWGGDVSIVMPCICCILNRSMNYCSSFGGSDASPFPTAPNLLCLHQRFCQTFFCFRANAFVVGVCPLLGKCFSADTFLAEKSPRGIHSESQKYTVANCSRDLCLSLVYSSHCKLSLK